MEGIIESLARQGLGEVCTQSLHRKKVLTLADKKDRIVTFGFYLNSRYVVKKNNETSKQTKD